MRCLHLVALPVVGLTLATMVVRREGSRAVLGVRAGAKLGALKVDSVKGVAVTRKPVRSAWVDAERWARATGDVLIVRGTVGGAPIESASSLGFVFSTFPALAAYDDGRGNAQAFTYPRAPCSPSPDPCSVPARAGASGDVVVRLTVWRPQRQRIAGEEGTGRWMDVGHLFYAVGLRSGAPGTCPQSSYSG